MFRRVNTCFIVVATLLSFNIFANSFFSLPASKGNNDSGPMTITADSMDMDFKNDLIIMIGNVMVEDKNTTMTSEKMLVYMQNRGAKTNSDVDTQREGQPIGGGKEAKAIVALGDVVVIQRNIHSSGSETGERKTTAGRADYDTVNDIIILTDNPVIYENNTYVKGNRIILWKDSDRMKVEGTSRTTSLVVVNRNENTATDTSLKK